MRVLVIGDPYMPSSAYAEPLAGLGDVVEVTSMQIEGVGFAPPRTESEHRLREYVGDPADIARAVAGHDVLIVHGAPVSSEVLDAARLRLVCCARGGPVNVDVAAATDRGIPVVNTPGKNAEAVAELTIAFALLLIRMVPRASHDLLRRGAFAESVFEGSEYFGQEAASVTLGLVGLGRVGREVASRARALGFTVLAYDPLVTEAAGRRRPGAAGHPAGPVRRRVPARPGHGGEPAHVLPRPFAQMRPGACFINTARESLVDEAALRRRCEKGMLAGAALDVLERPEPGTRHPLLGAPNVLVTPHIGGATAETLARGARRAVAAVASLAAGRVPADVVNPQVLHAGSAMT